jgi:hypothetical protein
MPGLLIWTLEVNKTYLKREDKAQWDCLLWSLVIADTEISARLLINEERRKESKHELDGPMTGDNNLIWFDSRYTTAIWLGSAQKEQKKGVVQTICC